VTTLLLDASALLAAFDPDDPNHDAAALRSPESVTPLLTAIERLADDGGVVTSTADLVSRAAEISERHSISVYDAAYAAAASQGGYQLISCDKRDLVSRGLAVLPADANEEGSR